MAAVMFNALAEDGALPFQAESAGTAALEGKPMAENSVAALEEAGIYPQPHRARQVNEAMIEEAELVLAMTPQHAATLRRLGREPPRGIHTLPEYATGAVGGDLSPRQAQGRGQVRCAGPAGDSGRRALHSPAGRDVISSQTRRATGGAHRERWRDGPCETAATGEAYRQASWQVPTPAEETPTDESKDMATKPLFTVRARNNNEGGLLLSLNLREIFEKRIPYQPRRAAAGVRES